MKYTVNVKFVPPYEIGRRKNIIFNKESNEIEFVSDKGTVFQTKEEVNRVLIDLILNREKYKPLVEGAIQLEVWVHQSNGVYGDMMIIKF